MRALARELALIGLVALVLTGAPSEVGAQDTIPWPAGNRLAVSVTGRVASRLGNRLTLVYTLASGVTSEQAAQSFVLRTYVPEYTLEAPLPWISKRGRVQDSAAAHWFALDNESMVGPGRAQDGFVFAGVGLLEIIPFRVQGAYDPPADIEESGVPVQRPPPFWANSAAGWTIGLVPLLTGAGPGELVELVRHQHARSCELGWITNAGVCRSLRVKLDQTAASLGRGQTPAARGQLQSFLNELDAQHGGHVTDNAYWLLLINAEFLRSRL
jgi:hypothetical protein